MLELDHLVVHLNGEEDLGSLKTQLDATGVLFEPSWGKRAKGFKVANIWSGFDYFELVVIESPDNLWQSEWAARHAAGERGAYCLFFRTDEDIAALYERFTAAGLGAKAPERTSFKWLFGLLSKKLPWRFTLLPKMPGTGLELGFIQYDASAQAKTKRFMVPNTEEAGLLGYQEAEVFSSDITAAQAYVIEVAEALNQVLPIRVGERAGQDLGLRLRPKLAAGKIFPRFRVANAEVRA